MTSNIHFNLDFPKYKTQATPSKIILEPITFELAQFDIMCFFPTEHSHVVYYPCGDCARYYA